MNLDQLLPKLQCPVTGAPLERHAHGIQSLSQKPEQYSLIEGVPDLRRAPLRLRVDLPWYEPWDDLDSIDLRNPEPIRSNTLPYHLDGHLAAIPGETGSGRWILEVGCGSRQCETWFTQRGFHYVGSDVDFRGEGPHVLADAHNLPLKDCTFDFYTSMAVYEHLVSPLTAALEAYRVLRPGGVFFGSAAFVYGFHDKASFHHMSHAGLFSVLRQAGFEVERMWPDWTYASSISEWGFRGMQGAPWRVATRGFLNLMEWSFIRSSNLARRLAGKPALDIQERKVHSAGSISFCARRPTA